MGLSPFESVLKESQFFHHAMWNSLRWNCYIFYVLDYKCASDKYLCDNGECIGQGFECDGDKTCADGSDETHCQCLINQFKCEKSGECVFITQLCDGVKDCKDANDEQNCCKLNLFFM